MRIFRVSLLWKILLSTSVALTLLFAMTAFLVQRSVIGTTSKNLEEEVKASFRAYESLWKARANLLAAISNVLSSMSDVRAAFTTGDQATIRDTARELWAKISQENALFLVADPQGRVIASLGEPAGVQQRDQLPVVRSALKLFPKQAAGFLEQNGKLFQVVLTPVYIESGRGPALINVLVAGYEVDRGVAGNLKESTGGSEFVFIVDGRAITSTLTAPATAALLKSMAANEWAMPERISDGSIEYAPLVTPLRNIDGNPIGSLWILRSFEAAHQRISTLQSQMALIWLGALLIGFVLTSLLARRIMKPVAELDRAAAEVSRRNYDYRVHVHGNDELARLATTFNAMCSSIQSARDELIRHERISTIGRLSTSIVHDLRSPLAAIYGGAEMLVDSELSPEQVNRLAKNIYRASRQIQELLQELIDVSRGKTEGAEICKLHDVITAAWSFLSAGAELQGVKLELSVSEDLECPMERARVERAFLNLMENALEAMPVGGTIRVHARTQDHDVVVDLEDTGPGISAQVRDRLFQPFVTAGKKNGLGLGLALSRQTLLDNGGDLWVDLTATAGARFCLRLPVLKVGADVEASV